MLMLFLKDVLMLPDDFVFRFDTKACSHSSPKVCSLLFQTFFLFSLSLSFSLSLHIRINPTDERSFQTGQSLLSVEHSLLLLRVEILGSSLIKSLTS